MIFHAPVLLQEVSKFLAPASGKSHIDATIGGGGHAFELLRRGARVLGIDRDPEAVEYVKSKIKNQKEKFPKGNAKIKIGKDLILIHANFNKIGEIAQEHGFMKVNGILFDLGVSSHQLEKAQRGFSFQKAGPLDMRMDPNLSVTAQDLINNFDERRLNEIFKTYGQEKFSRSIARAICRARQVEPINSTVRLAKIIEDAIPRGTYQKIHPATRAFQAIRIVVNSELLNLEEALPQATNLLARGGRLAIVSFHSLEDGLVKRFFKQEKKLQVLTPKPIGPNRQELLANPRARSAKLRVAERI